MSVTSRTTGRAPDYAQPTQKQVDYIRSMQAKLHLSNRLLDGHCESRFGRRFEGLDRNQCSSLIDEMKEWIAIPAELMREAGQMDLFGGAS